MNKYILVSKDAMAKDYLPIYGNKLWRTPNIDTLAKEGTVFQKHYTAAPSTIMSFYSIITGIYSHETEYQLYEKKHKVFEGETIFTKLRKSGLKCYLLWDTFFNKLADYYDCYRGDVEFVHFDSFRQGVGAHYLHKDFLKPDQEKEERTIKLFTEKLDGILNKNEDAFIWIHFPHVINGRVCYGSDIELFDRYIGIIRQRVSDSCIAITSDHGNMNGHKGKISYGHDVYQPNICIPLITPRINGMKEYDLPTSSVDLCTILFEKNMPQRDFIYSDTAYRAQRQRKLAIIHDKYKYIYNKRTGLEELYDLQFDPTEEYSIMEDYIFDPDRKLRAPSRELYYYPEWDNLAAIREMMRTEKERVWRNGDFLLTARNDIVQALMPLYNKLTIKK